jgi:hypothetical protein
MDTKVRFIVHDGQVKRDRKQLPQLMSIHEKLAELSPQTQADIQELAQLIRVNREWARVRYADLMVLREWVLWEAVAVKEMAFELAREKT